jgi:hypothetical protein
MLASTPFPIIHDENASIVTRKPGPGGGLGTVQKHVIFDENVSTTITPQKIGGLKQQVKSAVATTARRALGDLSSSQMNQRLSTATPGVNKLGVGNIGKSGLKPKISLIASAVKSTAPTTSAKSTTIVSEKKDQARSGEIDAVSTCMSIIDSADGYDTVSESNLRESSLRLLSLQAGGFYLLKEDHRRY